MNLLTRKSAIASILVAFMMLFTMVACGDNAVDTYLDEFEKFVVQYEDLAKKDTVTEEDATKLAGQVTVFTEKAQELATKNAKFSEKQVKRQSELTDRMMKAMQNIQAKMM